MLQGHFIDSMLAPAYRDPSAEWYALWSFMRGMTAPIFFTVTGMVFVFLLLRKNLPFGENPRVKKGIRRGLFLIGIGYLLRLNIWSLLTGHLDGAFWAVDVLHCIGIALLALIALYALSTSFSWVFPWLLVGAGISVFLITPNLRLTDWSFLPLPLEHYFTRAHGSVFTPLPWVGYAFFGGSLGWHIHRCTHWYRQFWWPVALLALGLLLHFSSSKMLMNAYEL